MLTRSLAVLLLVTNVAFAQTPSFESLNSRRIETNKNGMIVLGSWGVINMAGGITAYLATSDNNELKYFHGMNAIWGATNTLIALGGYMGAKKEAAQKLSCGDALHKYEATKRLYLVNAGLDVLYIGTGVVLDIKAEDMNRPFMWAGFGKSIAMQGIFLLLFDGTMYTLHQRQDKKWYKLLQGVCVTGNGIGWRYALN